MVQSSTYESEIKLLSQSSPLGWSKIAALSPFICNDGVLRAGGRLRNADIVFDRKHPILLPRDHHLTKLIVLKTHLETLHDGMKPTLATLRQKY